MAKARRVEINIAFNGKNVDGMINQYLQSVSYEDVAKDKSDSLDIEMQNIDMKWLQSWYPVKGDIMQCEINFKDWNYEGDNFSLDCGVFTIDDMSFSGNPKSAKLSGVAIPANASIAKRTRSKTWKKVTVQKIADTIARRYRLSLAYDAPTVTISSLEQKEQTDSEFLYKVCKDYNLGMKIFNNKIIIYDPGKLELKDPVATITPAEFIDNGWSYNDTLDGVYNGAKISYGSGKSQKTIYLGSVTEDSDKAVTLNISETAKSKADAKYKASAAINEANEKATTMSGDIWPDKKIVAGVCVQVEGFGVPDGKYFVEKVRTNYSSGGVSMNISMHKVYARVRRL